MKGGRTGLLVFPTLDEVLRAAHSIQLPPNEARKFFFFYDSKGWKVGKTPMKSFMSALQGWKLRWEERERERRGVTGPSLVAKSISKITKQVEGLE